MADDALVRNAERLRQNRTARAANKLADASSVASSGLRPTGTWIAGSAVLDTVSGLDGVVADVAPTIDGTVGDVAVDLSDGKSVLRTTAMLILRPTPPAASK
jgi:hypothetical protein